MTHTDRLPDALALIAAVFGEAWSVVSRLPSPEPRRLRAVWPETVRGWQDYQSDRPPRAWVSPPPELIDPACEVLCRWPRYVEHGGHRLALFLKAAGYSDRAAGDRLNKSHVTVQRWHRSALEAIEDGMDGHDAALLARFRRAGEISLVPDVPSVA